MPKRLSKQVRWEIFALWKTGNFTISALARKYKCKRDTIRNLVSRAGDSGNVDDRPRAGRKRKSTSRDDSDLVHITRRHDDLPSTEYQQKWKQRRGVDVSARTVRRRLVENGLLALPPTRKPLLTPNQKSKRVAWCRKNLKRRFHNVLFSDETTFKLEDRTRLVRRCVGEKRFKRVVKFPGKIHLWGCVGRSGFGRCFTFRQNMTSAIYVDILEKALLPSAAKLGLQKWILQEDNDPKHKSRFSNQWKDEKKIKVLPWPANSPDLNPIENPWNVLKDKVFKRRPRNLDEMEKYIHEEWDQLSPGHALNLVNSMPERMRACIAANGDSINY